MRNSIMKFDKKRKSIQVCHPERSEGSAIWTRDSVGRPEILRCAQDNTGQGFSHIL
jgi:hypothetical protein